MTLPEKLKKKLITLVAVVVPLAFLALFIGWDLSRLLFIGLAAAFVVQTLILFLARSKIGLFILVVGSALIIFLLARHDARAAATAAAFGILATIPSMKRKRPKQAIQRTPGRPDGQV
jgi:hypothetical protein